MSSHRRNANASSVPASTPLSTAIGQALHARRARRPAAAAIVLAALALSAPAVQAQSTEWQSPSSGAWSWFHAPSWSAGVPDANTDAVIAAPIPDSWPVIDGSDAIARDLLLGHANLMLMDNNATFTNRDSSIAGFAFLARGSLWTTRNMSIGTPDATMPARVWLTTGASLDAQNITVAANAGDEGSLELDAASVSASGAIVVGDAGRGLMELENGAQADAARLVVGQQSGSEGSVVLWSDSNLDLANDLVVGQSGTGELRLYEQAGISTAQLLIGQAAGSSGTVTVDGAGTHLESRDYAIFVGEYGEGQLTVRNGATVEGPLEFVSGAPIGIAGIHIGAYEGSHGTVVVTGAGSTLTTANDLALGGRGGEGRLEILDGGTVNNYHGFLGAYEKGTTGGSGSVLVQGAGSTWNIAGVSVFGFQGGEGTLEIADGGTVNSLTNAGVGVDFGAVGAVDVHGAGSRWNINYDLVLGDAGGASLSVRDGGGVSADGIAMGSSFSEGEIRMDVVGAGSQVDAGAFLAVQSIDGSTLQIRDGAVVNSNEGSVGDWGVNSGVYYDNSGTVLIEGEGSRWNVAGGFRAGWNDGVVTVREGGVLATGDAEVGLLYAERFGGVPGSRAEVWVDGAGSAWESTGTIAVGLNDKGLLDVRNGATVSSVGGIIGRDINVEGNAGLVRIDGAGSQWTMSGQLAIGAEGRGRLEVGNQGAVEAGSTVLGSHAGGVGELLVDGAGSRLDNSDLIVVGQLGQGSATVRNRATVSADQAVIGAGRGSRGAVTVEGAGSSWTSLGNTVVGNDGRGELTVKDGGRATSAQTLVLAQGAGSIGVVNIGAGGAWGTLDAPEIAGGAGDASVNFNHRNDLDFGVHMTGSLGVNKLGGGTTTLTADNDYAGLTTIAAGTLRLGDGGNSGGIVGNVRNNATLVVDRANTFAYAGNIDGTGAVRQSGGGTTVFTGEHAYTGGTFVDAGALRVGDGGTRGSLVGNVAIAAAGAFAFDRSDSFAFDGTFSGTGLFDKFGDGTLTLAGNSAAYVGHGTLRDGGLHMLGTIGGELDVLAGTVLSGTGTLGSVDNAGTISPGGSIGTLHMTGDYAQREGSTYLVDISPNGSSDLLDIAGSATIEGGEVYVTKVVGQYAGGRRYTIVDAEGGVTGTYDTLDQNLPFLDMFLSYDPNHVYLDIRRNDTDFSSLCGRGTFNQCEVARTLDSFDPQVPPSADIGRMMEQVTAMDEDTALAAFDRMSGEVHPSLAGIVLEGHALYGQTVSRRMAERREAIGADRLHGGAWVRTYGADSELDGDGNAHAADWNLHGIAVGYDAWGTENWLIGASANLMRLDADFRPGDHGEVDANNLSLYTSFQGDRGYFDAVGSYAWWDNDTRRAVQVGDIDRTATANYRSHRFTGYLEAGWNIHVGARSLLQPLVTLQYDNLASQGFREKGAEDLSLIAHSDSLERLTVAAGARWTGSYQRGAWTLEPTAQARWLHSEGQGYAEFDVAFSGAPDQGYRTPEFGWRVRGVTLPQDRGLVGVGLAARKGNIDLFVDYDFQAGDGFQAHNLGAGLRYRW